MTEKKEHERIDGSAPWAASEKGSGMGFPTTHLPWDVVKQPFYLSVECTTIAAEDGEDRGAGGFYISLKIGDRDNPILTDDEIEYVKGVVAGILPELGKRIKAEFVPKE